VAGAVLLPGVGLSFSSLGFGAITTFGTLLFVVRGWTPAWIALTAFTTAFIIARVVLGHLPDRIGGAKAALGSVLMEAVGLALIWIAPWPIVAAAGAVLTGLGYALVYPGLGLEAVRRVPPQSRGLAMGTYTAFFDLGIGTTSPVLGLIAGAAGLNAVFLASAVVVLCAAAIAIRLSRTSPRAALCCKGAIADIAVERNTDKDKENPCTSNEAARSPRSRDPKGGSPGRSASTRCSRRASPAASAAPASPSSPAPAPPGIRTRSARR
jgi:MFS family permease